MSKKRFVQAVIIRSLPELPKVPEAIKYAEGLYDAISQHGYGADKAEPRQGKDWYRELSPQQAHWFDRFWSAYNHKQDRNGAAMRWGQLQDTRGEQPVPPTDDFYRFVVEAATKEAQKQLPQGQVRKMAQGWLFEQRYNDYQPTPVNREGAKAKRINDLMNKLHGIKQLHAAGGDAALLDQIKQIENEIREARR